MTRDEFYQSKRWKQKREHILRRDHHIDQVALRDGIRIEADTVHHILPREDYPEYQWEDWNLVAVNGRITHKGRLHEAHNGKLARLGLLLAKETAAAHGIKMGELVMVIGMPGSGKTTWTRQNLGGGIAYDLDAIAAAFRLTTPDKGDEHPGSRRMAAALRYGWVTVCRDYGTRAFVIRTAPDVKELAETKPDKLVVCRGGYVDRGYKMDTQGYQGAITAAIAWAKANGVEVQEIK